MVFEVEELFYIIDKERSEKDNALAVQITPAVRDGLQIKHQKPLKPLTQDAANSLASSKDKELLAFLFSEELSFAKKNPSSLSKDKEALLYVRICHASTPHALKLLASIGRLFYNGKQLVVDLYGKVEFYYFADVASSPPLAIGRLKTGTQDFDIAACDFIGRGPPHWFIKGISLKFISTEASWSDLKYAYERQPRPLHELIEESRSDALSPRVVANTPDIKLKEQEPLPLLVLKDRLGAFADLWMDYCGGAVPIAMYDHSSTATDAAGKIICKRHPKAEQAWEKGGFDPLLLSCR
jgi:hypothetical protein